MLLPLLVLCGCSTDALKTASDAKVFFNVSDAYCTKVTENTASGLVSDGFRVSSPGLMDNVLAEYSEGLFRTGIFWPDGNGIHDFFAVFPPTLALYAGSDGQYRIDLGKNAVPFSCGTDILTAVLSGVKAGTASVPLSFVHPLSYLSSISCCIAGTADAAYSVMVEDIVLEGVPESGTLRFPATGSGDYEWICTGERSVYYCRDASFQCNSVQPVRVDGNPVLMIPTPGNVYRLNVRYRICVAGIPARDESSASMQVVLSPGYRGIVNLVFNPDSGGSCNISMGLTLDPWTNDNNFNYTIKLQ